jgi:periplasmic copper chaperone A
MLQSTAVVLDFGLYILAPLAQSHDYELKSLYIDHPFAQATPPGARAAGAYLTVENKGKSSDRLVPAASPVAGIVEVHEMVMDGGVMKMRTIPGIEIKPGAKVALKPGGYHIMLRELKQPLKKGGRFPLTLSFETAGKIEVSVSVEDMSSTSGAGHEH